MTQTQHNKDGEAREAAYDLLANGIQKIKNARILLSSIERTDKENAFVMKNEALTKLEDALREMRASIEGMAYEAARAAIAKAEGGAA